MQDYVDDMLELANWEHFPDYDDDLDADTVESCC